MPPNRQILCKIEVYVTGMFLGCLFGTFQRQPWMTDQFRNAALRESLRTLIKKQLFLFIPVGRLCEIWRSHRLGQV